MTMLLALIAVVGPFAVALLVRTFLPAPKPGIGLVLLLGLAGGVAGWLVGFLLGWAITPDAPTVPWLAGGAVVGAALLTWLVGRAVSKRRAAAQQVVR
ncbi:MAG: hypothetical protein ACTHX2_06205 [Microbacterium sp.]|jgi:hypothetical protein